MFAGQFVPVKIVTSGKQWGEWTRKYPREGKTIPILYVIRADGEKLYARSGSLSGDDLPAMLGATLARSGRILSDGELEFVSGAVGQAESMLEKEDQLGAARAITKLSKLSVLGQLESFATVGMRSDKLIGELSQFAIKTLDETPDSFEDEQSAFDAVIKLVEVESAFGKFPHLKSQLKTAFKGMRSNDKTKPYIKPAEMLVRADRYLDSGKNSDRKRAERAFVSVIKNFGNTPASEFATERLKSINPNAAIPDPAAKEPAEPKVKEIPMRQWSSNSGKFSIRAKFVKVVDGTVELEKPDGKIITVPLDKLSVKDQAYLKRQREQ